MIQTKQVTNYVFTCTAGEMTFNFAVPAESQSQAAVKLTEWLLQVCEELKPHIEARDAKVFTPAPVN